MTTDELCDGLPPPIPTTTNAVLRAAAPYNGSNACFTVAGILAGGASLSPTTFYDASGYAYSSPQPIAATQDASNDWYSEAALPVGTYQLKLWGVAVGSWSSSANLSWSGQLTVGPVVANAVQANVTQIAGQTQSAPGTTNGLSRTQDVKLTVQTTQIGG